MTLGKIKRYFSPFLAVIFLLYPEDIIQVRFQGQAFHRTRLRPTAVTNNIKELETQLTIAGDLYQRIDALNNMAWALRDKNPKRAILLSEEAADLARANLEMAPYPVGLAKSLTNLGYLNYHRANYELALSQSLEAIALCETISHLKGLTMPLGMVGISYLRLGNYSEALTYFLRQLKICETVSDKFNQAKAFNGMGIVHSHTDNHLKSAACFNKALRLYREIGNKSEEATALMNCCLSYRNLGDYENALACGFDSLQICQEIDDKLGEAMSLYNLGETYVASGQSQAALTYFKQGLDLAEKIDNKFVHVSILLSLGKVYYKQQQLELAQSYLHRAAILAEAIKDKRTLYDSHKMLAETYKAQGDFKCALEHFEQFHHIKEEIFNQEADHKLKTLEVIYQTETARKEAELYQLKSEELAKLNADKDRFFSIVAHDLKAPFGPLLGTLELLTEVSRELNLEQILLMSENALIAGRQIFELLENLLYWACLQMGRVKYQPERINLGEATTQSIRVLSVSAVSKNITVRNSVMKEIFVNADKYMLDAIIRNLVNNALKFTEPGGMVTISAKILKAEHNAKFSQAPAHSGLSSSWVEILVADTGVGIGPEDISKLFKSDVHLSTVGTAHERGTGLGLIICKEMVERNGGQIWVESELGQGTMVKFTLPLYKKLSG